MWRYSKRNRIRNRPVLSDLPFSLSAESLTEVLTAVQYGLSFGVQVSQYLAFCILIRVRTEKGEGNHV